MVVSTQDITELLEVANVSFPAKTHPSSQLQESLSELGSDCIFTSEENVFPQETVFPVFR